MSPLSTLKNCGNSSRRDLRRNLPTGVIRGSFSLLNCGPAFSASWTMVRNLMMRNGLPCHPMRYCRKNTGPLLVAQTVTPITSKTGLSKTNAIMLTTQSMMRFRERCHCGMISRSISINGAP